MDRKPHIRSIILSTAIIIFCGLEWFIDVIKILSGGYPLYSRFFMLLMLAIILLVIENKLKWSSVYNVVFAFFIILSISTFLNGSSLIDLISFLPFLLNIALAFLIIHNTITQNNYSSILKGLFYLSVIQLPLILAQRLTYKYFPSAIQDQIGIYDFTTGTFFVSGDVALGFLFLLWIIFFLFEKQSYIISNKKYFWVIWFFVGIAFINSKLIVLLFVITVVLYLIINRKIKTMVIATSIIIPLVFITDIILSNSSSDANIDKGIFNRLNGIKKEIYVATSPRFTEWMTHYEDKQLLGLTRGTVINYLLFVNDSKVIGNGPNESSRKFSVPLGDFTDVFYDLGLLGLLIVVWLKIAIISNSSNKKIPYYYIILASYLFLSFTVRTLQAPSITIMVLIFINSWRLEFYEE